LLKSNAKDICVDGWDRSTGFGFIAQDFELKSSKIKYNYDYPTEIPIFKEFYDAINRNNEYIISVPYDSLLEIKIETANLLEFSLIDMAKKMEVISSMDVKTVESMNEMVNAGKYLLKLNPYRKNPRGDITINVNYKMKVDSYEPNDQEKDATYLQSDKKYKCNYHSQFDHDWFKIGGYTENTSVTLKVHSKSYSIDNMIYLRTAGSDIECLDNSSINDVEEIQLLCEKGQYYYLNITNYLKSEARGFYFVEVIDERRFEDEEKTYN